MPQILASSESLSPSGARSQDRPGFGSPQASWPELRDYQKTAVNLAPAALAAGETRIYLTLPTGTGKAIIAAALGTEMRQYGRVLFAAHRIELVLQLAEHVAAWSGSHNVGIIIGAEDQAHRPVIVASIQTLAAEKQIAAIIAGEAQLANRDSTKRNIEEPSARQLAFLRSLDPRLFAETAASEPTRGAVSDAITRYFAPREAVLARARLWPEEARAGGKF